MRSLDMQVLMTGVVILAFVALVVIATRNACRAESEPCTDYAQVVSSLRKHSVSCKPGMTMTVDRQVQGALVTCRCPEVTK